VNEWTRVQAELFADPERKRETLKQAWRWTEPARRWLDIHRIDARSVTKGDIERYLRTAPEAQGPKDRDKRTWAFHVLTAAACRVSPARSTSPDSARARLDQVPERSPLGKAIAAVLAGAKSEGDRARWPTCLGTFLRWCDARGLAADEVWPGDIDAFRRDYLASGRTSPGEYVRVARRLVRELALRV